MLLGRTQTLTASHFTKDGFYLKDEENNDVLLPERHVPEGLRKGDELRVFVYKDSQNRPIATVQQAEIEVGRCALLRIGNINNIGAFADMGVDKQLLIPYSEQQEDLEEGQKTIVHCYIDETTQRLVGTTKLRKHIQNEGVGYVKDQEVEIMAWYRSEMGMNVIVDAKFIGLIHNGDMLGDMETGTKRQAFIGQQRPDGKLDIVLRKPGFSNIAPEGERILEMLERENGFLPYTDKSDPDTIRRVFNMSKKTFKKAIGGLYRDRRIVLEHDGIRRGDF